MQFVDRLDELERLTRLARSRDAGLVVVFGRRRVGKTRLLLEWVKKQQGIYWVADQSAETLQRRYLAGTVAGTFAGFDEVEYPDWSGLLGRLAREAEREGWR